jgi:hypothetical protein
LLVVDHNDVLGARLDERLETCLFAIEISLISLPIRNNWDIDIHYNRRHAA